MTANCHLSSPNILALQSEALISHGTLPKLRLEQCRVGRLTIRCQKLEAMEINSSTLMSLVIQCPQLRCAYTAALSVL